MNEVNIPNAALPRPLAGASAHPKQIARIQRARSSRLQAITLAAGLAASFNLFAGTPMFTESNFAQIKFLEGRWKGIGPDGKEFFEEYVLSEPTLFRSIRHADSTFKKPTDGSTVAQGWRDYFNLG